MLLAYELNIAGLLFDIVGAIGIFKTKIIGLEKTSDTKWPDETLVVTLIWKKKLMSWKVN